MELDKIDASGAIKWLKPAELGILPKSTQIVNMTLTFNYKRSKDGSVEERKSRASVRGDQMKPGVHFNPDCTSAPMVDRMAARMVLAHNVAHQWNLEHLDVKIAFLHEKYKYVKPVYLKEEATADGFYKHGNIVGILHLNLYGNPSGTFYYMEGLFDYLKKMMTKLNEAECCPIRGRTASENSNRTGFHRRFLGHNAKPKSNERVL